MRRPVTIARYLDLTTAQLARVRLGGEGIEAFVIEAAGFNPLLASAAGGIQLQVRERDIERARAILAEEPSEDDDEPEPGGEAVVRCPRCELEYCFHERARVARNAPLPLLVIANLFVAGTSKARWRCRKCEHVWDDAAEGPARMTRLDAGDPKPIFRLRRGHGGMGVFLGFMTAFFAVTVIASGALGRELISGAVYLTIFVATVGVGWLVGRGVRHDVCSEPSCRAALARGVDECPSCKGTIAGKITTAAEHFSASADARREIVASRGPTLPPKKTKKKAPALPAPAP